MNHAVAPRPNVVVVDDTIFVSVAQGLELRCTPIFGEVWFAWFFHDEPVQDAQEAARA